MAVCNEHSDFIKQISELRGFSEATNKNQTQQISKLQDSYTELDKKINDVDRSVFRLQNDVQGMLNRFELNIKDKISEVKEEIATEIAKLDKNSAVFNVKLGGVITLISGAIALIVKYIPLLF